MFRDELEFVILFILHCMQRQINMQMKGSHVLPIQLLLLFSSKVISGLLFNWAKEKSKSWMDSWFISVFPFPHYKKRQLQPCFFQPHLQKHGYSCPIAVFFINTANIINLQPCSIKHNYRVVLQPRFQCLQWHFIGQGLWPYLKNAAIGPAPPFFF